MAAQVSCSGENAEENEACRDGSVENTQEDNGRNHEGEADLLVCLVAEGSKSGSGIVVGPGICVND